VNRGTDAPHREAQFGSRAFSRGNPWLCEPPAGGVPFRWATLVSLDTHDYAWFGTANSLWSVGTNGQVAQKASEYDGRSPFPPYTEAPSNHAWFHHAILESADTHSFRSSRFDRRAVLIWVGMGKLIRKRYAHVMCIHVCGENIALLVQKRTGRWEEPTAHPWLRTVLAEAPTLVQTTSTSLPTTPDSAC